jgi:hypothetical protein
LSLNSGHPKKNHLLASFGLVEKIFGKYFQPKYDENKTDSKDLDKGFELLNNYFKNNGIPFTIFLHLDKKEFESKIYSRECKLIEKFALENKIPIIKELNYQSKLSNYNDNTHYTAEGQRHLAKILYPIIENYWMSKLFKENQILK